MPYLAYRFKVDPPEPGSEILAACLAEQGFESFEYDDLGVTAYIRADTARDFHPGELVFDDFQISFTVESLEDRNWNEEWEQNFEPVAIPGKLYIRAPFHPPVEGNGFEIVIMPKMSFGTGHHQTTRLMCGAMLDMTFKDRRVLDMGCGTGILAILAAKLGARDLLAIDIDEWPVENSIENAKANGVPQIQVRRGDIETLDAEAPFDVILANINRNVLLAHIPAYAAKLKSKGILVISGFFVSDLKDLTAAAAKHGLSPIKTSSEKEWAVMMLEKK